LDSLRARGRKFLKTALASVCATDVDWVAITFKAQRMSVEDNIDVFGKAVDDPVDLRLRGAAFE
jgi:hypothetical protein